MPKQKLPFSTSYDFVFATRTKLVDISIYINVIGNDIQPYTDFVIEKNGSYYWKSEKAKEDFYTLLESKKYKELPKLHKKAYEKGVFQSLEPCYTREFVEWTKERVP